MNNAAIANTANSHISAMSPHTLNQKGVGRDSGVKERGDNFNRLDIDVERVVAQRDNLTATQKSRREIEQVKVIHTTPAMSDTQRERAMKRAGNDLYEVFTRIQEKLKI